MNRVNELIKEYCPDGVPFQKVKDVYTRVKGTPITAGKMKEIACDDGEIRIFAGGKTIIDAHEKDIPKANITRVPAVLVQSRGVIDVVYYDKPFTFKNEMWAYTSEDIVSVKFLYYVLKNSIQTFRDAASGMGSLPQISLKVTEEFMLPVPPLEVQREIVHILDYFTLLTAELTAELTARKKQYEFYRDKLLTFGNDTLECRLKDICDIFLGLTATPNYTDAGVKFISAQNTSNDFLDLSNVKYISETDFESATSNAKPQRGDLLFTRVGSNLGHPVIVETDEKLCIFVSLGYLRVRNKKQVVIGYLKHWMNTDLFWSQVRKNVHGAAKVNLNTGWLKEFRISLPPLETQERIVHVLDNFEAICTDLNIGLPAEIEARQKQYEYYRDKLLSFKELS